jgi:hypothetical protein
MARGGGGARKVRPEGQNMRCVVQLLTGGGKGWACTHAAHSPSPPPHTHMHANFCKSHFCQKKQLHFIFLPSPAPSSPSPIEENADPPGRRAARRVRGVAPRVADPAGRHGGAERRHVRGGRLLRLRAGHHRGVQTRAAPRGKGCCRGLLRVTPPTRVVTPTPGGQMSYMDHSARHRLHVF